MILHCMWYSHNEEGFNPINLHLPHGGSRPGPGCAGYSAQVCSSTYNAALYLPVMAALPKQQSSEQSGIGEKRTPHQQPIKCKAQLSYLPGPLQTPAHSRLSRLSSSFQTIMMGNHPPGSECREAKATCKLCAQPSPMPHTGWGLPKDAPTIHGWRQQ